MELNKVEMAVVIAAVLASLGEVGIREYLDTETIEQIDRSFADIQENTSPKVFKESTVSAVKSLVKCFLAETRE